jgi:hypothetical protein
MTHSVIHIDICRGAAAAGLKKWRAALLHPAAGSYTVDDPNRLIGGLHGRTSHFLSKP